ncbi:YicC/YloC family endoribonuclease [Robertmurraya andreesenii]|uniref:Uncharacterized protein (TIGR00255 family) n=1 Tax=Anoxybacillus andreesenii TaxID=1325932 RepID=A0ABT9V4T5_9BACL|nr:YicC/YloC family endoribonuclease [Robertmurraya andreesenii]MDQ0155960.1 uncharacterized protein (TIGR00255 family) [Robertmurraya andreesenii]
MIVSMTGFGRSNIETGDFSITVEVKSVNHRFLEYQMRMPRQLLKIEDKIKKIINEYVARGRLEVYVTVTGSGGLTSMVNVDWHLLDEYVKSIKTIQEKYHIDGKITLQDLLAREELISVDENHSGNEELEAIVLAAVGEASKQLRIMREMEGKILEEDIHNQLDGLEKKLPILREYAPRVVQQYSQRLQKRMEDFANGLIDEARLISEIAIFAEKADINEELTRLQSHIDQFYKIMQLNESIGRKLDFLLQEMNREVNTIGSKANDSGIAKEVVEMKSYLEKMKEQVQNIE